MWKEQYTGLRVPVSTPCDLDLSTMTTTNDVIVALKVQTYLKVLLFNKFEDRKKSQSLLFGFRVTIQTPLTFMYFVYTGAQKLRQFYEKNCMLDAS